MQRHTDPLARNTTMGKKIFNEDRYVNPYTDFGFKKLFGTEMNKDLLLSFINSLLHGKEKIKSLTYLNTEHLGISEADRRAVFDVYCENEREEKILVEMQRGEQQFFKDRSLYYSTFPIQEQGKKGSWDYQLKAVYVIGILNFTFDHKHDTYYHHEVQLTDRKTQEVFYDLTRLMEKPAALQERVFTKLFKAAEIAKFTKEEYDRYEESLKVYRDWQNTIATAEHKALERGLKRGLEQGLEQGLKQGLERGLEQGLEQGFEQGEQHKAKMIARQMKSNGIPTNIIAQCTGLDANEIEQL